MQIFLILFAAAPIHSNYIAKNNAGVLHSKKHVPLYTLR